MSDPTPSARSATDAAEARTTGAAATDAAEAPIPDGDGDDSLLRRFEPVLRFTHGEHFYPMSAEAYVAACDLLTGTSMRDYRILVPAGDLTPAALVEAGDAPPGEGRFLRFVEAPLNPIEIARFNQRPDRPQFRAPGRLARVGILARMVDAVMLASLLVRGNVPGGTAAAAALKYQACRTADPRIVYHGRVVRQGDWIVLHYLFFYAMNDWRSTFEGANDHEADWEQSFVILEALADGGVRPVWFAAAAHEEEGADLRRRWDDPRLERLDDHPIVYPGAGSHATYTERGEYIMRLALPGERFLAGVLGLVRRFWRDTINQPDPGDLALLLRRLISVPFVDYARGDGLAVGPGTDVPWTPVAVSDDTPWVGSYRGLWGQDTGDRLTGERPPAGPKYTRTGSVRQSWNDPLGFVGLASVATPTDARRTLKARVAALRDERAGLEVEAAALALSLPTLDVELRSIGGLPGVDAYRVARTAELAQGTARLAQLRSRCAELGAVISGGEQWLAREKDGWQEDPRAHLRRAAVPEPPAETKLRVFAETWAALSVGVLVIALAVILWFHLLPIPTMVIVLVIGYLAIESFAQRRVEVLLLRLTVVLASISAVLLMERYLAEILLLTLGALGVFILLDNARELLRR